MRKKDQRRNNLHIIESVKKPVSDFYTNKREDFEIKITDYLYFCAIMKLEMEVLMKQIFRLSLVVFVVLSSISCGSQPESNINEESSSNISVPDTDSNSKEITTAEADPENVDESLGIPDKPLSEDGPWLIMNSSQGLFAINPDGSGLTQFVESMVQLPKPEQITAAKRGGYIAYHGSGGNENDTAIHIVDFPSLELVAEIPLFTYSNEPDWNALRAIQEYQSMAFSPDGRYLAFMGVIDGPTSDLYTYSLESDKVTQLTDGRTQGYKTVWSPDGKYILHTGAYGFGTGAGFSTEGVWAAKTDTSVKSLYTPPPDSAEMILGWVNDETFVVYSWSQPCGPHNLRTFNVENRESTILWRESFKEIALDPSSDTIVLNTWRNDEICVPEDKAGIFFIPVFGGDPQRVSEITEAVVVWWSPAGKLFIASGGGFGFDEWALGVDTFGRIVEIERPSEGYYLPEISPRSNYLFWTGQSPHIGSIDNSIPTKQYFDESIQRAIWTPDGGAVIFAADSGLYIAHQPEFEAILISPDVEVKRTDAYFVWLNP